MDDLADQQPQEQQEKMHASTYSSGEESGRLASAAQYFGLRNNRTPLRPVREQNYRPTETDAMIQNSYHESSSNNQSGKNSPSADELRKTNIKTYPTEQDSQSILKFGSTVWNNVGLVFSDSTLEAARMHSVGVTAADEHVAGDGTLHLRSIVRRKRTKKPTAALTDMFKPPMPIDEKESEGAQVETTDIITKVEEEEDEYEDVVVSEVEGGSIPAAIFGIIKGMVGPAILYLPRGFAISGYAVAIPAMFCATATYLYCATRLLQCWKVESNKALETMEKIRLMLDPEAKFGTTTETNYGSLENDDKSTQETKPQLQGKLLTYPELARRAFGSKAILISGGIAAMQFGVCLTYLIFVPQNIYELIRNEFGVIVPKQVLLIAMLVIEIPLCWIRDIRKLTPTNVLATILIGFGLVSVLFIALFNNQNEATDGGDHEFHLMKEIVDLNPIKDTWALFVGTSFFCFEGSITLLVPLQEAVFTQEDRARFPSVNQRVISSTVVFYVIFAMICWASFGDSVRTALTASLPKSGLSSLVQLAYSIAVILTFPLQAFPALEVVCHTTQSKTNAAQNVIMKRNITATFIVCLLGVIAIMSTNYLGNVVSLIGSFVGIPIALIYPPLMHNKLVADSSKMTKYMNICLAGIGLFGAGAASYTTIASWGEAEG